MSDLIFECLKCGHSVYTSSTRKLLRLDCPECGEEAPETWRLKGVGDLK